jgi:hypothetical protein
MDFYKKIEAHYKIVSSGKEVGEEAIKGKELVFSIRPVKQHRGWNLSGLDVDKRGPNLSKWQSEIQKNMKWLEDQSDKQEQGDLKTYDLGNGLFASMKVGDRVYVTFYA